MTLRSLLGSAGLVLLGCGAQPRAAETPKPTEATTAKPPPPNPSVTASAASDPVQAEEPTEQEFPEFSACSRVRAVGTGATLGATDLELARREAFVWPALCGKVLGWAGIGIVLSTQATGFSADGTRFVVCGTERDCIELDLKTGTVAKRVTPDWPNDLDGSPVTTTPAVAKLFRGLRAPAPQGSFPYAGDLRVSWILGSASATLDVTLLAVESGEEEPLRHFPLHATEAAMPPIVLERAVISPHGDVLELETFSGQGPFEVALVNLHAAAARLFRKLAASHPERTREWLDKATLAEKKARAVATSFAD